MPINLQQKLITFPSILKDYCNVRTTVRIKLPEMEEMENEI